LSLFNGTLTTDRARALTASLATAGAQQSAVTAAWRQILGRDPTPAEHTRAVAFLAAQTKNTRQTAEAMAQLIRALLNTNEFLYVD
jgi:hypothetical protein